MSGAETASCTGLPFGDGMSCTGSGAMPPQHFTGQYHDSESGLDYFNARHYSSSQARFMSPDPAGAAAVDPNNPQSWDRYAYVNNNALSAVDPLGLYMVCIDDGLGTRDCTNYPDSPGGGGGGGGGGNGSKPCANFLASGPFAMPAADCGPGGGNGGGGGGRGTNAITTRPPKGPSCSSSSAQFVTSNIGFAAEIAGAVDTSAANILGLAAFESGWGKSNLAVNHGNYFGLTAGPNFGGTTGVYHSPNGNTYGNYASPGFLNSGMSFANSSFGSRVFGITNPAAFAQALELGTRYNSEALATPYAQQVAARIADVEAIIAVCVN